MRSSLITLAISAIVALAPFAPGEARAAECLPGYFQFSDGSGVDIAPANDGRFRWRRPDGTTGLLQPRQDGRWSSTVGWTGREDGLVVDLAGCERGLISFAGLTGRRVELDTNEVRFPSAGAEIAGRLVLPLGRNPVPIVVLLHGSEDTSALKNYALQRLLPAQGVGVFVYDKRGTGNSTGQYTHDIRQLAADAKAALETAKSLAGARRGRIGYYGTSQGGWTAPLAATLNAVDFVIVGYGLAVSPAEEDNEALELDMLRHGYGAAEVRKALEIGAAAQSIVRNNFQSGYGELRAVIERYKNEPWFRHVRGNITGVILQTPEATLREIGPQRFRGALLDYDPMPVLRKLKTPQLWILGGEDIDAPYRETHRRLTTLQRQGHRISIVVYPDVEHGLYAFETKGDERLATRQPASLQRLLLTFARGMKLDARYDNAQIVQ